MSKEKSYESVNKADDWRDFTENPPQNGWYDIWRKQKMYVKDKNRGGKRKCITQDVLYLGLFRDGKWLETPDDKYRWQLPMIRSDLRKPYVKNNDVALQLALAMAADYSRDYESRYRLMLKTRIGTTLHTNASIAYCWARAAIMSPKYQIITMGAADPEAVMADIRKRVIQEVWKGYKPNNGVTEH